MRILTRYMVGKFLKIWALCVLGVPFIFIVIDLTDSLDSYLAQGASRIDVFWHYVYAAPHQALLAFPIASLLAAVFSVSSMTRNFEITAAKAGGVSFYRLTAPVLAAAFGISLLALGLTELVPTTNRMADEALGETASSQESVRRNFVYRSTGGRIYRVRRLEVSERAMESLEIQREGSGADYPSYTVVASEAYFDTLNGRWTMQDGRLRLFPTSDRELTFRFDRAWQRDLTESPQQLLADPKDPDEMGYEELGRFIEAIERSGGNADNLKVERALKISFPFACFIITLFGVPLANTTRRGGAPLAVGIALATTIVYMVLIRVSQALGAGGVVSPRLAAWLPNLLFLAAGSVLYWRVRT
ncbi:MAG: LptF/LptG family permease [Candidatus Palauibacterales bacterium]|nr:LptF/LptG family permease [Candidatus Palauibacterales bacterium]